jgi:GntR family transcriptional regulator/MocR family aminotransferase
MTRRVRDRFDHLCRRPAPRDQTVCLRADLESLLRGRRCGVGARREEVLSVDQPSKRFRGADAPRRFPIWASSADVSLVPGLPAVDEFPIDIWERLRSQVLAQKGAHLLRHASSRGDADLRKAVATYLCDFGGARCHPDQILIVGGMQQAMLISAMALVDSGEPVWIEDPGFHQARRVFVLAGARVVPKPLDEEGIVIARSAKEKQPKLIHVTPSHQYRLA